MIVFIYNKNNYWDDVDDLTRVYKKFNSMRTPNPINDNSPFSDVAFSALYAGATSFEVIILNDDEGATKSHTISDTEFDTMMQTRINELTKNKMIILLDGLTKSPELIKFTLNPLYDPNVLGVILKSLLY